MKRSILVTGAHRSGTTFVGSILRRASGVGYVQEPFNPQYGIKGFDDWYTYITAGSPEETRHRPLIESLLSGRARYRRRPAQQDGTARRMGRRLLGSRDSIEYLKASFLPWKRTLLLKDPIAALSSRWLHDTFNIRVVAMMRHPAGFAASNIRLNWEWFFFNRLMNDQRIMNDFLGDILGDTIPQELPLAERSAVFWRFIYTVLDGYASSCSSFRLVRLEDISRDPQVEFRKLFDFLDLDFSPGISRLINERTGSNNPVEAPEGRVHSLNRNSRDLSSSWKRSFSESQLARIMELAGPPAAKYYPE